LDADVGEAVSGGGVGAPTGQRLRDALGGTLPFCIVLAALLAGDVRPCWMRDGCIALGAGLSGWSREFLRRSAQFWRICPGLDSGAEP